MMVVSLLLVLNFSIVVSTSSGYDRQEADACTTISRRLSVKGGSGTKPEQLHHFATNKNKTYTPQFEKIANKYGLDLDDARNKEYMHHQGRHPKEYHDYVLDSMTEFDKIAQGDKNVFLKLYDNMKNNIMENPDILYKDFWRKGEH